MKRIIVAVVCLFVSVAAFADGALKFTILYTNDLHGWMMPFDYATSNAKFMAKEFVDEKYVRKDAGGLARRATFIKKLRKESADPVILIDAGDLFNRGPYQALSQGELEIRAYDAMKYDMCCVGNNDLKGTQDTSSQGLLVRLMRRSEFPWLSANLTVGGTGQPVEGLRPFVVRRINGVDVGFLGLTADRSRQYPQVAGWTIEDPIEAAKKWIPIARAECDILILVTHVGYDVDRLLASSVSGIDVIVGGDSHTFLPDPAMVKGPDGREVPIVQDGAYGVCLGRLSLSFEDKGAWRLASSSGALLPIDASTAEDPEIAKILQACE